MFELVRFEEGEFTSGEVVGSDGEGSRHHGDGSIAFNEAAASRSVVLKQLIARGSILRAAETMWSVAPRGFVEIIEIRVAG